MSQNINSQEPVPENDEPNVAYDSGPNTSSSQSPRKNANSGSDPFVKQFEEKKPILKHHVQSLS